MAGKFRLTFCEHRNTPIVTKAGVKAEPKPNDGRVTKTRLSTDEEEKILNKGKWIRVDEEGNTPSDGKKYAGKRKGGQGPSMAARAKAKRTRGL